MGISRVIYYWLLLALLAHVIRCANAVGPPVQATLPIVNTFPLDNATVDMLKHNSHLDDTRLLRILYVCGITLFGCLCLPCLRHHAHDEYHTMHMTRHQPQGCGSGIGLSGRGGYRPWEVVNNCWHSLFQVMLISCCVLLLLYSLPGNYNIAYKQSGHSTPGRWPAGVL